MLIQVEGFREMQRLAMRLLLERLAGMLPERRVMCLFPSRVARPALHNNIRAMGLMPQPSRLLRICDPASLRGIRLSEEHQPDTTEDSTDTRGMI